MVPIFAKTIRTRIRLKLELLAALPKSLEKTPCRLTCFRTLPLCDRSAIQPARSEAQHNPPWCSHLVLACKNFTSSRACTHAPFAKVDETLFFNRQRCVLPQPQKRRAPAAAFHLGRLQNTSCLGCGGSDGQAYRMIRPSWSSRMAQKCPKGLSCAVIFFNFVLSNKDIMSVMVRTSRFICVFCGFLKGPAVDSLAPAQSKRRLPLSTCPSKLIWFSYNFVYIPRTLGVEIRSKDNQNRA